MPRMICQDVTLYLNKTNDLKEISWRRTSVMRSIFARPMAQNSSPLVSSDQADSTSAPTTCRVGGISKNQHLARGRGGSGGQYCHGSSRGAGRPQDIRACQWTCQTKEAERALNSRRQMGKRDMP